jgi:O-antigen/teichoic acid export membrane protein
VLSGAALVPPLLSALGTERFALWSVVTGFSTLLAFADFGLGTSLMTALARRVASGDARQRAILSTAYLGALLLCALYTAVGLASHAAGLGAGGALRVAPLAAPEASATLLCFALTFAASVPLGLVGRIRLGLQEGHVTALFQILGTFVGFSAVRLALRLHLDLPWLVGLHTGVPLGFAALDTALFFGRRPSLAPSFREGRRAVARELWDLGSLFFSLQIAMAAAFASDALVAAWLLGPDSVAVLAVHAQPFTWIAGLSGVFFVALWPAYADALAQGERSWVAATLRRSLLVAGCGTSALGACVIAAGPPLFSLWLGDEFAADRQLLLPLALTSVATTLGSALSMVLNAAGEARFQRRIAVAMGAGVLLTKVLGAAYCGTAGLLWGTLLAYLATTLLPTLWFMRGWLGSSARESR